MAHDPFEGCDQPLNIDSEAEDTRKILLGDELSEKSPDTIEPVLDI